MSFEYQIYRSEIFNFLSTITVKFDAFAKIKARQIAIKTGKAITLGVDNPYYINLCGEYSKYDDPIYVNTVETGEKVLFDKNLKVNFPKTFAIYKVGSKELYMLQQTHKDKISLIKNIMYPAWDFDDIKSLLEVETLTLLSYDKNILYPTEQESIITTITNFINYLGDRWYVPDFDYEDLYPAAFYGVMFSLLPMIIMYQRVRNLHTPYVHPQHVWEFLVSNGLDDYRSILTHEQSLFLYRNIKYLYRSRGKASNLKILAKNLLNPLFVTLIGKNTFQETDMKKPDCILIPEIIDEAVYSNEPIVLSREG